MNLVENKTLRSPLRDEEAAVVENAVRLAIDSVLNVLYGLSGATTREYQRMVADRDKEIQRLEGRLTEIERELQVLRRHGCTCGLFEAAGTRFSGSRQGGEEIRAEPGGGVGGGGGGGGVPEVTAGPQECDLSLSLGVYARPSCHFPSQYPESVLPSSPSCLGVNSTCASSESSGVAEAARNLPSSPGSLAVKEEPCDVDAILIEWELSEERAAGAPEQAGSPRPDLQGPDVKHNSPEDPESSEGPILRDMTPVNPPGFQTTADQLRNKKKTVPMSQLTEEAQRLKRAAWRAASKRYYARKIARQQAGLQHLGPAAHAAGPQRGCFAEDRRKRLISDLPEEAQTLRREVWRAASRRYYVRKVGRHHTESPQYGPLMGNLNPADDDAHGPTGEGPLVISGIMCS